MKIFCTTDTHFEHDREIIRREEGFEKKILKSIKQNSGDLLIHCGDFCIGNDAENHKIFMEASAGFKKKILVRGNHDGKSDSWYYDHGWDFVCLQYVVDYFKTRLIFSHAPVGMMREDCRERFFTPMFPPIKNIHGHFHGNNHRRKDNDLYSHEFYYDVAPDIHGMKIVNLQKCL